MNCNRFVGTGLVESHKPISRVRRYSSAKDKSIDLQIDQKHQDSYKKCDLTHATAKHVNSVHLKVIKTTSLHVQTTNRYDGIEDLSNTVEEQVIFYSISIFNIKYCSIIISKR